MGNVNPIGSRGVYDEAKRFVEVSDQRYIIGIMDDTGDSPIFNTFYPRMRVYTTGVVLTFLRQAILGEDLTIFGDGMQTRSFCYVADLVEGIYRLMLSHTNEPVNIGNPGEMTILEFAHLIKKIAGSTSEIVFKELPVDDPKVRQPDIQRARSLLGWEPQVPIEEGLTRTYLWMKDRIQGLMDKGKKS